MRYVIAAVLVLLVAAAQTSALSAFRVLGVHANFMLVLLLSWAMVRGLEEAMVVVPMGGLALGLMDSQLMGVAMLALVPLVLLTEIREARIIQGDFLLAILLILLSTLAYEVIILIILRVTGETVQWWGILSRVVVPAAIVNALLVPPVYGLLWLGSRDLRIARPL
jgi:rod shape-determining protein MreD